MRWRSSPAPTEPDWQARLASATGKPDWQRGHRWRRLEGGDPAVPTRSRTELPAGRVPSARGRSFRRPVPPDRGRDGGPGAERPRPSGPRAGRPGSTSSTHGPDALDPGWVPLDRRLARWPTDRAGRENVSSETSAEKLLERVVAGLPGGRLRTGQARMAAAVEAAIQDGTPLLVQAPTGTGKGLAYLAAIVAAGRPAVVATATKALQDQLVEVDIPLLVQHGGRPVTAVVLKGRSSFLCRAKLAEVGGEELGSLAEEAGGGAAKPGDSARSGNGQGDDGVDPEEDRLPQSRLAPARPRSDGRARSRALGALPPAEPDLSTATSARPASLGRSPMADLGRRPGPGEEGELVALRRWEAETATGDLDQYPGTLSASLRERVVTTSEECPGAKKCPFGTSCFAELARARAADADIVVVNLHLLCLDLEVRRASHGVSGVLPEWEVAVVDEAHLLTEIATSVLGTELRPGRLRVTAAAVRRLYQRSRSGSPADGLGELAARLAAELERLGTTALPTLPPGLEAILVQTGRELARLDGALAALTVPSGTDAALARARQLLASTAEVVERLLAPPEEERPDVRWVGDGALRRTPLEVGPLLADTLFASGPAVLTSATLRPGPSFEPLARSLGLDDYRSLEVESPFDYRRHALLYCARDLPDPRDDRFEAAAWDELESLIVAAGGRTLALFTSRRAMQRALEVVRARLDLPIYGQDELGRAELTSRFRDEEESSLFATMGFWQGISVEGPSLSLVIIDRLPFRPPDDPVSVARRQRVEAAGGRPFVVLDLPRAAVTLAQGVGRLIRSERDRGVVAVLDRRLATAPYRRDLLAALPPMRRVVDRETVRRFLRAVACGEDPGEGLSDTRADELRPAEERPG